MSVDVLINAIKEKNNPTALGLDPTLEYIPKHIVETATRASDDPFTAAAEAIFLFNKGLIDALYDIVPAVKPQIAYYEMYGWQGVRAFKQTVDYAHSKGLYVIGDIKRNDIGSTAAAYACAHLGYTEVLGKQLKAFGEDACTVNPYLGTDGIEPFLKYCSEKMVFILVKTSNESAGEYQDKLIEGKALYRHVADNIEYYGKTSIGKYGYSGVGAVVGATYPEQLLELRESCPHTFFLVPGYGR